MKWDEVVSKLRFLREEGNRDSRQVVDLFDSYSDADKRIQRLGSEQWLILEQVVIAALDCGRRDLSDKCLADLIRKFPKSNRVAILRGMTTEADKNFSGAAEIYDSIIAKDATHAVARKRKVALLRSQGKTVEAIKELVEYTKTFMADQEAWTELMELYVSVMDYSKAAFCCEELILANPHNHLYYQRYAEIRYTQGGADNLENAKSIYSQAIKLNSNNVRALYGLILTTAQLAALPKTQAAKKAEYTRLAAWASDRLGSLYASVDKSPLSEQTMSGALGITFNTKDRGLSTK